MKSGKVFDPHALGFRGDYIGEGAKAVEPRGPHLRSRRGQGGAVAPLEVGASGPVSFSP